MGKTVKKQRLKTIMHFSRPYKFSFLNLFICIVVTSFSGMLYPFIFGRLVDEVFYNQNRSFFLLIVISYGVLFLGGQALHFILNMTWSYLMTRYLFDIRKAIFDRILELKAKYLSSMHTGDLISIINNDSNEFMNFIHWNIFYLSANIMRLLMSVVFVLLIDIRLAALMAITVPLSVYVSRYFVRIVKKKTKEYRYVYGQFISWVFEMIKGMRDIILMAASTNIFSKFAKGNASLLRKKVSLNVTETCAERSNSFISLISTISIYVVAGILVARGHITVGAFIAVIEYFRMGISLLRGVNEANLKIQNNLVSVDKVIGILQEETEKKDGETLVIKYGAIDIKDVSFNYNENVDVLRNINLSVHPGENIALVGKSGSGKSTLVGLLLGLYRPDGGSILLDNEEIRKYSLKSLRNSIGMVHQDIVIFEGSIRENLLMGKRNASDSQIWSALDKACIGEFIRNLPEKLDTIVGEKGIDFSGGQKQRIAIARIFLKNPPILIFDEAMSALDFEAEQLIQGDTLIGEKGIKLSGGQKQRLAIARLFLQDTPIVVFDEATSSLDHETEKVVHKAMEQLSQGRTFIVVAHRLSSIINADKVVLMDQGKIIGQGHHSSLKGKHPLYDTLFLKQYNLV